MTPLMTAQTAQRPLGNTINQESRHRAYAFTVWNYNEMTIESLKSALHTAQAVRWVIGFEIASTTGGEHLQCFVRWPNPKTIKATIALLKVACVTGQPHVEVCKGDDASNLRYCSKDGKFESFGFEPSEESMWGKHMSEHIYQDFGQGMGDRLVLRDKIVGLQNMILADDYEELNREEKQRHVWRREKFWELYDECEDCRKKIGEPLIQRW